MNLKSILKALIPPVILTMKKHYFTVNKFNLFRKSVKHINVRDNSVLIIEFFTVHGEVLPGLVKYSLDLGYNVDVIIRKPDSFHKESRNDPGLFYCFNNDARVNIKTLSSFDMNLLFRSSDIDNYKHIILNTFTDGMEYKELYKIDLFRLKPICMIHNPDINHSYVTTNKIISLVKMHRINKKPPYIVNSHYYGNFSRSNKNTITTFIALNTKDLFRRNINLLFEATDKLYEKGIYNFHVKIIGNGIPIPDKYRDNFILFDSLNFQDLYKEILSSDFILALIDRASVEYTNKASGSYQLSYGFLKPLLLQNGFSDISGFTDNNSVLYSDNSELYDAMNKCIEMSDIDYTNLIDNLEKTEKELYSYSLNNLKTVLELPVL